MKHAIKAHFKQSTVNGSMVVMQFEALKEAKGVKDASWLSGENVFLTIETEQQEPPIEEDQQPEGQTTINNYFVNSDTGEITEYDDAEVIDVDDAHSLPEGGEE